MSALEKGFFDLEPLESVDGPRPSPVPQNEYEIRRKILAEERTGEIVMKSPGIGYAALSLIYHSPESSAVIIETEPAAEHDPSVNWLKLL